MAASDKPFRSQNTLDIVYALSCIVMLLSVIWMFWQDYNREYKHEQRVFRNVEVGIAQRLALQQIPSEEEFNKAEAAVKEYGAERNKEENKNKVAAARARLIELEPKKEKAEANYQTVKADVESINSFRNIALEHRDDKAAKKYDDRLGELNTELADVQAKRDQIISEMKREELKIDEVEGKYTKAVAEFKKVNDRFDTQVAVAINKRWGFGDWLRTQPVLNSFSDPLKIQQFTINDIPIDYNFKMVTRFDRCMSCHAGIDRPAYTQANLEALTKENDQKGKLEEAKKLYERRLAALGNTKDAQSIPNPNNLTLVPISDTSLTPLRIREFKAHPRLDLFVGTNSKHPAEKFGCSSCHYGQGSGTSFNDASHSPNSPHERESWGHERGWEFNHMWDFPMLPTRFAESSCLKCHHQVTDLISTDNRVEAPKLLRGYSLIKENGCFGCHEISGWKGGQRVGPDLRLEPTPPLEELNPLERERVENDPDNRPGNMRKVGPALTRISEKVHREWIEKWLRSPSSFRPDTKMPHYYGLSNNDESVLPEVQKAFPNTEIASIAYFLSQTSKDYLARAQKENQDDPQLAQKDENRLTELLTAGRLSKEQKDEMDEVRMRIRLRKEVKLVDLSPDYKGDVKKGRVLFTERGCLACHAHSSTEKAQGSADDKALYAPEIQSEANFGPNLSQVAEKLTYGKTKAEQNEARRWLIQWVMKPQVHSPRSRMPVTHLTTQEAADIAAWLLAQPAQEYVGPEWDALRVKAPSRPELEDLARVYLTRMLSKDEMERFLKADLQGDAKQLVLNDIGEDEKKLLNDITVNKSNDDAFKSYLGKKAVSRLGCYACHDIPGFENAKPIGVGLNDWGKKPADRLAFEDIGNFFKNHYYSVEPLTDKDGVKVEEGVTKEPYEEFYKEALIGHYPERSGYLNQKIRDPRSYDYNRVRAWDDLSRMPKFHLARGARKRAAKGDSNSGGRIFKAEAEAREAVATFVLGLVAEAVPTKSTSQPTGDRLAEVKGRQILDKYNCNGCHLIRPGVYDLNAMSPQVLAKLEEAHSQASKNMKTLGEYTFLNHVNWVGRNTVGSDRLTAYGVRPTLDKNEDDGTLSVILRLSEALRFVGPDKMVKNIPAGIQVTPPASGLTQGGASLQSQADFDRTFAASSPYGGAFADLMVSWLIKKDKEKYPLSFGDSGEARASLPPSLIGQGERTQTDWLYSFLLEPTQVRRMTILRMPKFNMSKEEAKTLVDYFAAVTRQTNPGIGLTYPFDSIPQRTDFDSAFWKTKNAAYVSSLKRTVAKDDKGNSIKGKDGKDTTVYEERIAAYTPLWEQVRKTEEASVKSDLKKLDDAIQSKTKEKEAKKKALADDKGDKKTDLQKEVDELDQALKSANEGKAELEKSLQKLDVKSQQKSWEEKDAYLTDAYRLLTSRELCTKCHQVGNIVAGEQGKQGPPLALANQRLRPDWIERWVDMPQRFVPYPALMPPYFSANELKYQHLLAGPGLDQIDAIRDTLMNLPRISSLPINRLHNPDQAAPKK